MSLVSVLGCGTWFFPIEEQLYCCRYDWRERKVYDIHDGVFDSTRFASAQGTLIPLNPQEALVVYRPHALRRPSRRPFPPQQLWLFELVHTA